MNRPCLFLSAVSGELRTSRKAIAAVLHSLGYDTVSQDDFPTGHGELRQWLRTQIERCEGLLQLVGDAYGAEPPDVDPDYGRVSYTQFEFFYARFQVQKTWVIEVKPDCPRDTPVAQLDLPADPQHPDPAGWQAERQALQRAYRQRLREENHLRHSASSPVELENVVLRLNDELGELRRRTERSWRRLSRAVAAVLLGLLVLGGGGWWAFQHLNKQVANVSKVDAAKIRAHLVAASEAARQRDLAAAEKATGWEQRQKRRDAAEAAHAARLQRVESLAADIAEVEGRGEATTGMREMTRILAEENVDAALA
jgi:hypothetical protein